MCQVSGCAMLAHGRPSALTNISSLAGRFGFANYVGYCAGKFGVIGLIQQLAAEVASQGIGVNCICPGSIDTDNESVNACPFEVSTFADVAELVAGAKAVSCSRTATLIMASTGRAWRSTTFRSAVT